MGENGSSRKNHALTAIVQMLTAEVYGAHRQEDAAHALEEFHELADSGDPLANAIRNELTGQTIEEAFVSPKPPHATHEEALRATPVYPYLTDDQRERARVLRVAEDAIEQACSPGSEEPERTVLRAILDDLAEHRSEVPDTTGPVDDVVEHLPEPWQMQARKAMQSVRNHAGTSYSGDSCPPA